jgi:hypothetical protein
MERERSIPEENKDIEKEKLLPEIAEILNISISQLEQYPADVQLILCQTYINECKFGKDDVAKILNQVINLDIDNIGIIKEVKELNPPNLDNELSESDKKVNQNKRTYLISRNQIIENARKIAELNSKQQLQQTEQINRNNKSNY